MADVTVVIAAESHQRVRALLDGEAGIVVAGEARSLAHAFVLVARLRPAVLLLDFGRGWRDALAALQAIRSQSSRTRIILLTTRRTPESSILEAVRQGAGGYLGEAAVGGFLARAVRAVHAGEAWVPRRLGAQILRRLIRARGLARHARRLQRPAIGSGKPAQPAAVLLLSKLRAACTPSTRVGLKSNRPSPAPLITHESPNTRETTPSQAWNPRRSKWRI